ncbi:MAG: F0F1 ATP synthase subunit gamma [Verrucomicrobia bacterium]|nr:F0F1 ATP synthase subunit gamma [Verrucomicrobiota bacterium]
MAFMQRAERNIGDLLEQLRADFHQQRQNSIDAELFDLISGFEVLGGR